jgi:Sap, sulfolipid-1-addressing protein
MTFAKLLPLAFVMIAGPQILSAIFLATTERWKANSAAFVAGAAVSITAVTSIGYLLSTGASDQGTSNTTLDVIIIVLLVAAAIHKYVTRKQSKPPAWMGKLETAQPKGAFKLGFLLLGVFPSDILTSIAVGGYASSHGAAWWEIFGFVGLTLLLVGLPALTVVALGKKAEAFLPKVRDWMNDNSWIVSEIVIALFIALTASSLSS